VNETTDESKTNLKSIRIEFIIYLIVCVIGGFFPIQSHASLDGDDKDFLPNFVSHPQIHHRVEPKQVDSEEFDNLNCRDEVFFESVMK